MHYLVRHSGTTNSSSKITNVQALGLACVFVTLVSCLITFGVSTARAQDDNLYFDDSSSDGVSEDSVTYRSEENSRVGDDVALDTK